MTYVLKEITYQSLYDSKAFLKVNYAKYINSKSEEPETEIEYLKLLNDFKVTPYFYECLQIKGDDIFVQAKVHKNMNSKDMKAKFDSFLLPKKILKFLQMAIAIKTIYTKGITRQNIKPENFVAMDAEINDIFLIDFSYSTKVGEPGISGSSYYYYSSDKLSEDFIGQYLHDAFAFAMTIYSLLDFDRPFFDAAQEKCPKYKKESVKGCLKAYQDQIVQLNEITELAELFTYIAKDLFNEESSFSISTMIQKMVEIYHGLPKNGSNQDTEIDDRVRGIQTRSQDNIQAIRNREAFAHSDQQRIIKDVFLALNLFETKK